MATSIVPLRRWRRLCESCAGGITVRQRRFRTSPSRCCPCDLCQSGYDVLSRSRCGGVSVHPSPVIGIPTSCSSPEGKSCVPMCSLSPSVDCNLCTLEHNESESFIFPCSHKRLHCGCLVQCRECCALRCLFAHMTFVDSTVRDGVLSERGLSMVFCDRPFNSTATSILHPAHMPAERNITPLFSIASMVCRDEVVANPPTLWPE